MTEIRVDKQAFHSLLEACSMHVSVLPPEEAQGLRELKDQLSDLSGEIYPEGYSWPLTRGLDSVVIRTEFRRES